MADVWPGADEPPRRILSESEWRCRNRWDLLHGLSGEDLTEGCAALEITPADWFSVAHPLVDAGASTPRRTDPYRYS